MLVPLLSSLHKICNEMKLWIINKTITITLINILFIPNSGILSSPRSLSTSQRSLSTSQRSLSTSQRSLSTSRDSSRPPRDFSRPPRDLSRLPRDLAFHLQAWRISRAHFSHFTYVTAHSPTLPSLYLRLNSFCNPSVASPTSQFILQPFFRFSCITSSSLNSPGEPPMIKGPPEDSGKCRLSCSSPWPFIVRVGFF